MTLRFQMRRENALEFSRQFYAASPTYRRARMRVRLMAPVMMLILWIITTSRSGLEWESTVLFLGFGILWYFFYPAQYDRSIQKNCEKVVDEGSYRKNFGECELTLSDSGIHSTAPIGESKFHWSSVDRALLTETYLIIFLNGPMGYPIPIAEIGREAANAAYEFVNQHLESKGKQSSAPNT